MNHFIAGILRIVLLEGSVALLVIARLLKPRREDPRHNRRLDLAFVILALLAIFSWTNFGALRGGGGLVHRWEQYHFFFGSKYLPEVGYFDLYKATILADREGDNVLAGARITRDLTSFDEVPIERAMQDSARVRANFSDARWAAFKADWRTLSRRDSIWQRAIDDHGNSASPAWALCAAPIAYFTGIGPSGQVAMGLVDPILLLFLFASFFPAFGLRPSCIAIAIFGLTPFAFDYLAGSLLRWDWLFALGMCLVFWQRKRPLISGAFLGYAVASKLFPLFFGVGLLIKAAWDLTRTRKLDRRILRFSAGASASIAIFVLASSLAFGGISIWKGYAGRIAVAEREKFYSNQYSFRTLYLQFATSSAAEIEEGFFAPNEIKQGRADVELADHRFGFHFWQLALTALIALSLSRADELEALAIGLLLVFVWLMVNAYYWNMLALPALIWVGRDRDGRDSSLLPLISLHIVFAAFYLYQHLNRGYAEGYFVALGILLTTLAWAASRLIPRAAARRELPR